MTQRVAIELLGGKKVRWKRRARAIIGLCLYPAARGKVVRFPSVQYAGQWINPSRPKTAATSISHALGGKQRTAFDIRWRYEDSDWPKYVGKAGRISARELVLLASSDPELLGRVGLEAARTQVLQATTIQ